MSHWFATDWDRLFAPQMSLPEILVRGVLIYLGLCLMLRVVLRRQAGRMSLGDLLVVTLVTGVCRNPLVRDAYSITDGLLMVATILLCSYANDWLSYYVPLIHALMHAPPMPLIREGQVLDANLRHELMTTERLKVALRCKGVREPAEVADAYLEGDGKVSVIKRNAMDADDVPLAADRLQEQLAWHQQRIAEIKDALTRQGVRNGPRSRS